MKRSYWGFYWPLAVTGTALLLANQFQNGVLARYPDATAQLAIFAYAFSTFSLFRAALVFVPQMANLLARSREAHRVLAGFLLAAGLALTAPLVFLGASPPGEAFLGRVFEIDGENLETVCRYVRLLAPLVLVQAFRQYFTGLLIQRQSTRLVTVLTLSHLAVMFFALVLGLYLQASVVSTLVTAQWAAAGTHLVLLAAACWRYYDLPLDPEHEALSWRFTLEFFWPVAVTSMMFALSRPVLYAFVARGPDPFVQVAALRIAFDLALFFHQPLNQFRNLFATFGMEALDALFRFQVRIVAALSVAMLVVAFTGIHHWIFTALLGVPADVASFAGEALRIMCALPLVVGVRNYFHGIALAKLKTTGMAFGAVLRVGAIYAAAALAQAGGFLDHRTAAAILVIGFLAEALVVLLFLRARRV